MTPRQDALAALALALVAADLDAAEELGRLLVAEVARRKRAHTGCGIVIKWNATTQKAEMVVV